MEFTPEQITEMGLSEDQVTKVKEVVNLQEAELKKGWDGKANKDAEGIIDGAIKATTDKFGIDGFSRVQGEKAADALGRIAPLVIDSALAKEKLEVSRLQNEYNEKLKTGGDENLKQELLEAQGKLDILKQKEAQFKDYEENDYKGKYESTTTELSGLKLAVAYQYVKPSFPDTVNKYEANAKWKEFIDNTNITNTIELDSDNIPWAVNKENEHIKVKLETLVEKDKTISELAKGREATGLGSGESKTKVNIEGIPFAVPEKPTSTEREKLIREYLTTEKGLSVTSNEYAKEYKKFNDLILKKN